MSAGDATKSAERYVCIIVRIALRVGVEFILLLGEVCHVTNCDNSEHAFVNKGDSRYFVCSSWNICILVDSFFIVCPWIILNILLECYSSTRRRTGIYSWRQGSRFVFCWFASYRPLPDRSIPVSKFLHGCLNVGINVTSWRRFHQVSSLVFEVGDCMKVLHLSC